MMISCEEAWARLRAQAAPLASEAIAVETAGGRVLAGPVVADFDAPATEVSAMDGYAVRDAELKQPGARLAVIGESFAGSPFQGEARPGACVRIFTGAVVPEGFDRVVIQENVLREGDEAVFPDIPSGGRNIRSAGSDFRTGETLLDPGTVLEAPALIAAAGADIGEIPVWRRPAAAILATGDELAPPGEARKIKGGVPDSVSIGVTWLAQSRGARIVMRERLRDDPDLLAEAAGRALNDADIIVVTGGASVGERDYARAMFGTGLEPVFSKVAMKPGKPVWAARKGTRWIIGLPGNPGSALVTARLFLAPLLAALSGRAFDCELDWRAVKMADPLPANGPRENYLRAFMTPDGARLSGNQESGAQGVLGRSTLLVRRAPGAAAQPAGTEAAVLDLA